MTMDTPEERLRCEYDEKYDLECRCLCPCGDFVCEDPDFAMAMIVHKEHGWKDIPSQAVQVDKTIKETQRKEATIRDTVPDK